MSALTQLISKYQPQIRPWNSRSTVFVKIKALSEYFWGGLTFLLFLALGPFSAIAVVIAVFSLVSTQEGVEEPRAVEKQQTA